MVSKREKRKWKRYLESEVFLLEAHLAKLMYDELKFDMKMRKKALKMARKREVGDYIK